MRCYMKINKEELIDLYINKNFSMQELMDFYKLSFSSIQRALRYNNITKPLELIAKNAEKTCLKKYGVKNPSCMKEVKDKKKQTFNKHYGCDHYFQTQEFKEQADKTKEDRYNNKNFNNRDLAKETLRKKYNVENVSQIEYVKKKKEETIQERYGVDNVSKLERVKQRKRETCLKNYGVEYSIYIPNMLEKVIQKGFETRRKNGTFNGKETIVIDNKVFKCSAFEKAVYLELIKKYKVEYQYKSEKYPFACDFYLPEIDLYIEVQGHWMHGIYKDKILGPYDKNNPLHNEVLEEWKEKSKSVSQYAYAIKVWTIKDPLKRQTAKENNLNWIEFFNMKQFMDWFEKQK